MNTQSFLIVLQDRRVVKTLGGLVILKESLSIKE